MQRIVLLNEVKHHIDTRSIPDKAIVMLTAGKHLAGYAMVSTVAFIEIVRRVYPDVIVRTQATMLCDETEGTAL